MLPRLRAYRGLLIGALLLLPVSSVFAMVVPYLTMLAIDDFIVPGIKAGSLAGVWGNLVELMMIASLARLPSPSLTKKTAISTIAWTACRTANNVALRWLFSEDLPTRS